MAFRDSYEKIFTSSPAIWETLGDAVFIDNVNQCYFLRKHVADDVLTPLQEDIQKGLVDAPVEKVLDFDFAELAILTNRISSIWSSSMNTTSSACTSLKRI